MQRQLCTTAAQCRDRSVQRYIRTLLSPCGDAFVQRQARTAIPLRSSTAAQRHPMQQFAHTPRRCGPTVVPQARASWKDNTIPHPQANIGAARLLVRYLTGQRVDARTAKSRIWLIDSKGLVTASRLDLTPEKREFAVPDKLLAKVGLE